MKIFGEIPRLRRLRSTRTLLAGLALAVALALVLATPMPATAAAQAVDEDYSVLIFSKTAAFRHSNIDEGIAAIEQLGLDNNVAVDATENAADFTDANLAQYAAVIWLSTTGDVLNATQQAAFEDYIANGGGFVGIHAASDTEYDWPWFAGLVGAYFEGHPPTQNATIIVEDPVHPSTAHLPTEWSRFDEWYNFQSNPRHDVHVLASLDEQSYNPGPGAMGADHPITWCHDYEGGRSWYTGLGHTEQSFAEQDFLDLVWGGIETAAGAVPADCGASIPENFQKVALDETTANPMDLEAAEDGRLFYIDRNGTVRIVLANGAVTTALSLDVYTGQEFGLVGMTLDPNFDSNGWIYLYYSPNDNVARDVLSRFTVSGNTIDPATEEQLLVVEAQRDECCHTGGALQFDSAGNLYLATGDNTNPFAADGFAPIDEQFGRAAWDAQRTSANSNVLTGKILRITPQPDGSYTIPPGNMFDEAVDFTNRTRPEIFAMGFRNPYRIGLDPVTDKLLVADFGPDAASPDPARGPDGIVEWNIVDTPGFYGWPYCVGDNQPFVDFNFANSQSGSAFDCTGGPVNNSPNNTGLTQLPPAIGTDVWYGKQNTGVPEIGTGGAPMAGGVYRFDASSSSEAKWPEYWDGKAIFGEWNRTVDGMFSFQLDATTSEVVKINNLFPGVEFTRLMAFDWGPDGVLYFIEWGTGQGGNNADSGVYKLEYVQSERRPIASASADVTNGGPPLTVSFSSAGSADPDGGTVTFEWDFDGNGTIDSTAANPVHVYTDGGDYDVQLVVTDDEGESASATIAITVGNTPPVINVTAPVNGSFFTFGDTINFDVSVTDAEDGTVDCNDIIVQPALGHDEHSHPYAQYSGCTGSFPLPGDDGHVGANTFGIVTVTYTDEGGGGAGPLTAEEVIQLRLNHTEAEHFAATGRTADGVGPDSPGVTIEDTDDVNGGKGIGFISDGDWWSLDPADLSEISSIDVRVASATAGGVLEVRADSPDGPLVGQTTVAGTGGWQTWQTVSIALDADAASTTSVYFVARDPNLGTGYLMNVNWMEFNAADDASPVCSAVDDFDGSDLDRTIWSVVREDQSLQVAGSALAIPLTATDIYSGFNNAPNIVLRDLPVGPFVAETTLTMDGINKYEQAGLIVYGDDDNYVKMMFQARDADAANRVFQWLTEVDKTPDEVNTPTLGTAYPSTVRVRITSDGTVLTGSYSTDGAVWSDMPASSDLPAAADLRVGLMAVAGNAGNAGEVASFDSFTLTAECDDDEPPVGFACASAGGNLTWSDDGVAKYWVYRSTDSGLTYSWIGRTIGSPAPTSFTDLNPVVGARYQVHYEGIPRVECSIESEPPDGGGGFTCSADAGNLTWTDDGVDRYWVYRSTDGGLTYSWIGRTIGFPAPTSFVDPAPVVGGLYQVHYAGIPRQACTTINDVPVNPVPGIAVPGIVEAEAYDAASSFDTDSGNVGNAAGYNDDVDVWNTYGEPGLTVGRTRDGEYTSYPIDVSAAGTFDFAARVATGDATGGSLTLSVDGVIVGTATIGNTGGWWSWQTVDVGSLQLAAGSHVLRASWTNGYVNFDRVEVASG